MQKEKLFPAQEKTEKIHKVIRRHWFTYVIFWFLAIALLIPFVLAFVYILNNLAVLSAVAFKASVMGLSTYLLFILGLLMYGFVDFYLDVYILTDKRIVDIKQNGFFKRVISELNLRQVQDVNAEVNGIFATLLHYGNVYIQTAGEQENFVFQQIPHPYETSKNIIDLHEQNIGRSRIGKATPNSYVDREEINHSVIDLGEEVSKKTTKKILKGIEEIKKQEGEMKEGESIEIK